MIKPRQQDSPSAVNGTRAELETVMVDVPLSFPPPRIKGKLVAGGVLGALAGLTALTIPAVGPLLVAGPLLAALSGAAVGGVVGGLAGGSGALTHIGVPEREAKRVEQKLHQGAILIAVHSNDPARLDRVLTIKPSQKEAIRSQQ